MILEIIETYKNRLRYQVKYSYDIEGYIEEDNIVGTYSKDINEVLEIFRVIKNLPLELKEKIIKKILFEEYKHIYILRVIQRELDFIII
jgi:hypothetical protein